MTHRAARTRRRARAATLSLMFSVLFAVLIAVFLAGCRDASPSYVPHDRVLRAAPLYFYPIAPGHAARAAVVFFGNDVGFWDAHDRLARRLAAEDFPVVGVDVKQYVEQLAADPAARERRFGAALDPLLARALRELHADTVPLVLGGHSFGADLALWLAAHDPPPRLIGVLALGPTIRSHFQVTFVDRSNLSEPAGPESFSVADQIHDVPPAVRIALLRGSGDRRVTGDSALRAAGGPRLRYSVIPFAGHSLRSLTIAGPMVEHAVAWLVTGQ